MADDTPRWGAEQVLSLTTDASSLKAGQRLATAGPWRETGCSADPPAVWGLCQGSGKTPYQASVDLTGAGPGSGSGSGPAYRCSCPSRKFPCKHTLGLLLLWSAGDVPAGEAPPWVTEWLASRSDRQAKAAQRTEVPATKLADPAAAAATQARRAQRVDAGVAELERWLTDQVRQGVAAASRAGYGHWDGMAARLVDAQAPGLASAVRRLATVAAQPDRLLAELGLLWLLVRAYQRLDELAAPLAATVRSRVGFPVSTESVLAGPRLRDDWAVVGIREEADDRLVVRRAWLRGAATDRSALVLSFAPIGQPLAAELLPGTTVDADLCFYPGNLPLRALVAERHGEPRRLDEPRGAATIAAALHEYAAAVAAEPWLDRWPLVLRGVTPVHDQGFWHVIDDAGAALRLDLDEPWRLVAAAGGGPCTLAGEWSAGGLRPLTAWVDATLVRV